MNRRTFLRSLLALPFAAKIAVALSDHSDLVARVDKSIIDETRKRLGMEKVIMFSNPTGWDGGFYERWANPQYKTDLGGWDQEPLSWDKLQAINHSIHHPKEHRAG